MQNAKYVVITTGGTAEPIDDVRSITNFSTGKFGYEIAKALADFNYRVDSLTAQARMEALPAYPSVEKIPFTNTESLKAKLLASENPDIIIMAAAVSDYAPIPTKGKISSNKNELIIRCKRTPKILPLLRPHFGPKTFIVGFKLLSNVSTTQLVQVAQKQLIDNNLDLVIANDLANLVNGYHPLIVVTPECDPIGFTGTRVEAARFVAETIHERASRKR